MIHRPTFRCSELPRVLACSGSATLTSLVEPRSGSDGDEGTALHWQIAQRICQELGGFGKERLTTTCTIQVNKNSVWIADYCFREVRENVPDDWALEVEVPLAYAFARFILSGHIDALAINYDATEAIGWDYKTGYDPVDAAEFNDQVLGYIVLLLLAYPNLRKVTFHILQPRNDEDEGFERVSTVTVEGATKLADCASFLEGRLNACLDEPLTLNSGRKQCRWCSAFNQCPAIRAELNAMKLLLTPENLARIKTQADDATLADLIIMGQTVAGPMKDAQEMLHARLDTSSELVATDGTKISRKLENGSYSFPDKPAYMAALKRVVSDDTAQAEAITFSVKGTKEAIHKALPDIPKSNKKPEVTSVESVFDANFRPLVEQGKRRLLVFSA